MRRNHLKKSLSSEIIEIGAVKLDDDYAETGEFSCLIKPSRNDKIEKNITKLTGIEYEDVKDAPGFEEVLAQFEAWILEGCESDDPDEICIYSWSWSDYYQLKKECEFKEIEFSSTFENWKNFQDMFPDITDIQLQRQISLEYAAQLADISFDNVSAHRASYDARVTGELVKIVMTGEYKTRMAKVRSVLKSDIEHSTFTLSDRFGAKLKEMFNTDQDG